MNLSCGSRTIKYLIFTFNFFFVITGIVLISVGASIHAYYTQYNFFLNSQYFSLPNLLIATGSLIFIICFLGCYGAIRNSWIMLMGFSVLLGIIFIFEFSAGIAGYVLRNKTENYLNNVMKNSMKDYTKDSSTSYMWDLIQREYECCGVTNYDDWEVVMKNGDLPISCCPPKQGQSASFYCNADTATTTSATTAATPTTATSATTAATPVTTSSATTVATTSSKKVRRRRRDVQQNVQSLKNPSTTKPYSNGCELAFGKWVRAHAVDIGVVCFTLAVLQLIGIGFAFHLSKQLKNSYYST